MTTINRVAFLGDYVPRQCGVATFTTDICEAVAAEYPHCECIVGAVNDRPEGYDYSTRIVLRSMKRRSTHTDARRIS